MTNGRWQEQDLQDHTRVTDYDQEAGQTRYKAFPERPGDDGARDEMGGNQPRERRRSRLILPFVIIGIIIILIFVAVVIFALVGL